jgi:hypothetical protein
VALNAVERLWDARRSGDWESVEAQLHAGVRIALPHQARTPSRDEYLTFMRLVQYGSPVHVDRVMTGRSADVAVLARVERPNAMLGCAGFYELREGLIGVIEETWFAHGEGRVLEDF